MFRECRRLLSVQQTVCYLEKFLGGCRIRDFIPVVRTLGLDKEIVDMSALYLEALAVDVGASTAPFPLELTPLSFLFLNFY